jgi:hypothetical protein
MINGIMTKNRTSLSISRWRTMYERVIAVSVVSFISSSVE